MKIPFKTNWVDKNENVMIIGDKVVEIRYDVKTRAISVVIEENNTYTLEDLDAISWQKLKKLTIEMGGTWTTKSDALNFLVGKKKDQKWLL